MTSNGEFAEWLINEKKYNKKVASDIVSRFKRALTFIEVPDKFEENIISDLDANPRFKELSSSIKSQMRRSLRLYIECNK